ncbi:hypothetical protein JCM3766R1_005367, partial [Sporobolomyces carnicolor]
MWMSRLAQLLRHKFPPPRPLTSRVPPSRGYEAFPRRAPHGYFSSTPTMRGLSIARTPEQYARISRLYPRTRQGALVEWTRRLGRRTVEEEHAAREWIDAPYKWYEAVAPVALGKVVRDRSDESSSSVRRRTRQGETPSRETSRRNGALPRVSAPAFRGRRPPTRRPGATFSNDCELRPFPSRSFSSTSRSADRDLFARSIASRAYSTTTLARKNALRIKFPRETKINLERIMNDFRDLELLDLIKGASPKSAVGFKDAHRALYPLYHRLDQKEISHVTFGDLDQALPELYSGAWTTIEQRLVDKSVYKLEALTAREKAVLNLVSLHSIGPKRAEAFVALGCKTAQDLVNADKRGTIKLSKAQKIGLVHREDFDRLIPREEMRELASTLETTLARVDDKFECEILGSYRRGVGFSSDIDLAVRHKDFTDKDDEATSKPMMTAIVRELEAQELVQEEHQLMFGPKKYAGLVKLPTHRHYRRIDIRLAPYHSCPYMLLGNTGDSMLMKLMRHIANKKGWCLNEFGMGQKYDAEDENPNGFRPGTMKIVKSEQEIFELLGFPYLKPEERELSTWRGIFANAGKSVPASQDSIDSI